MRPRQILVKRYLRRYPKTPRATINGAMRQLHRLGADKNLEDVCHVQVSDEDSQVMADKRLGFRRNACSVVNVETGDVHDEVEAAVTIYHESLHARDIAQKGQKAITKENEIAAHEETIEFLKDWQKKEKRNDIQKRVAEEIQEEQQSIAVLGRA